MTSMNPELIDDREYRRGMILGLTLAEVLLLLLFLLMLALGSELIDLQDRLGRAEDGTAAEQNRVLQADLTEAEQQLQVYKTLLPDLKMVPSLKLPLDAAARIDPNDPPSVLKRGVDLQIALGLDRPAGADDVAGVEELLKRLPDISELKLQNERLRSQLSENGSITERLEQLTAEQDASSSSDGLARLLDNLGPLVDRFEAQNGRKPTADELALVLKESIGLYRTDKSRWPPIINLSEANNHFFERGSAALTPGFRASLQSEIPDRLLELLRQYDVDTIEVIGHTDEQPIRGRLSNLDDALLGAASGQPAGDALSAADNAGLGMARAVTVMKVLRSDPRLAGWEIIPLTGAQLIDSNGKLSSGRAGDVRERRRIEIRLRGSGGTDPARKG